MRMRWLSGLLAVVGGMCAVASGASLGTGRAWTPADSVALRYFLYDLKQAEPLIGGGAARRREDPASLSPDGRHFFFVSFSGDLERDESIGQIWVFSLAAVESALKQRRVQAAPLRVIEMRSRRGGDWQAPIIQPSWADANTIEFVGTEGEGPKQLYHVDIATGERLQLTQVWAEREDMTGFAIAKRPSEQPSLIYKTQTHVLKEGPLDMPLSQYPSRAVRTERESEEPLRSVFHPFKSWIPVGRVYSRYQGSEPRLLTEGYVQGPWLSPDGRHAVVGLPVETLPATWREYEMPDADWLSQAGITQRQTYQFHLLDLRTGELRAMLDAPIGRPSNPRAIFIAGAFWSADSSRVLLVNTRLPLSEGRAGVKREPYVIDYRIEDGQWDEVMPIRAEGGRWMHDAQWDQPHERVLLKWAEVDNSGPYTRHPQAAENTLLSHRGGRWHASAVPASHATVSDAVSWPKGLKVHVAEAMNTPQIMVAERAGRTVALTPPDPALAGVHRQDWERMDVPYGDRQLRAYLLRPTQTHASEPPPLVILLANPDVLDEQFNPDGGRLSGFAAQSLAAQGFAVLHMDSPLTLRGDNNQLLINDSLSPFTPSEGPAHVGAIDAAIGQLSSQGLVDAGRVGLVGFSRSGYHVNYVITHPGEHRIGAAVIFDSYTGGYGDHVNAMAIGRNIQGYPKQYAVADEAGVVPTFWENKQGWLDAPAFNLEKVRTAALFTVTGLHNALAMLETVGGWRHMQLPLEYRMYPEGSHVLTRPREQEDALRGTVEWMGFWLQDRAPADAERAAAWQSMKARWQQRLKVIDATP